MYYEESDFAIVDRVTELAKRHDVPNAQIALAWMLHKPGITSPIIGATKKHHIPDAMAALDLKLDESEIKYLEELYQPHPVLGFS
jgi:aryl-alcohol dehydrogenase-like predicted oxidoreductase